MTLDYQMASRRHLVRRRSISSSHETDDRGWTSLHIEARRGDLKQVSFHCLLYFSFFKLKYFFTQRNMAMDTTQSPSEQRTSTIPITQTIEDEHIFVLKCIY
jgi:hypothetical protein